MKNVALAGTAQCSPRGQLPTFDLDLASFLPPLLTFIYLFFPTTESIRRTVSLVAYHRVHIACREAPSSHYQRHHCVLGADSIWPPGTVHQKAGVESLLVLCLCEAKKNRLVEKKEGSWKGFGKIEMEMSARGRLGKCLFNLLRAYRPGHAALGRGGGASVPRWSRR